MTDEQKTLYALGVILGRNVQLFHLTPAEIEFVKRGMGDSVSGKTPEVDMETFAQKVQELARSRQMVAVQAEKDKGKAFLEKAGKESGAQVLSSGVVYKALTPGTGASPTATDVVRVHYTGKLIDGKVFDSSVQRGQPAEFPLNQVVKCWTDGVQKMKVGEKAQLVCPSDAAYGDSGSGPAIPGGATLIFEVELLEIVKKK
jgi:FKBP-type peptidyl-prolyl cis-trans isomerase FkpA